MKKTIVTALLAAATLTAGAAIRYNPDDVKISNIGVERQGQYVIVNFDLDASQLKLKSNQEVSVIPTFTAGAEQQETQAVTVAGRNRYYYHLRNNDATAKDNVLYHNGKDARAIPYRGVTQYEPWMNNSRLSFSLVWNGCCNEPTGSETGIPLADIDMSPDLFDAELVFIAPEGEGVKIRKEKGSAFIDFPVNKTVINADYRKNPVELAKIVETIDKVRNDKDLTITGVSIKGYASPEGSYANNERLAKGRTEALADYVRKLYRFPSSVKFTTGWEAEDWNGLREAVEKTNLDNKQGLLSVINSKIAPDERDAKLKRDYPQQYAWLLANVYPALRHSDYEIDYTVRNYADVDEIIRVMHEAPGKLSLGELFLAAQTMQPGSDEFNEVFEIAVRMYPGSEVANLNAANSALSRGDLIGAERFLKHSGNSPEAEYARGMAAALAQDYTTAEMHFGRAGLLKETPAALESVRKLKERPEGAVKVTPLR